MCGASGITAAVTKVHCLCDVYCCLAMDQERLQGSFPWRDNKRTLIKFNVLLGKSALECYKLKEGLGTHVPSYETVFQSVKAI